MFNAAPLLPAIIARYYTITEDEFPAGPEVHLVPPKAIPDLTISSIIWKNCWRIGSKDAQRIVKWNESSTPSWHVGDMLIKI